jgi:hypothetical protein
MTIYNFMNIHKYTRPYHSYTLLHMTMQTAGQGEVSWRPEAGQDYRVYGL